MNKAMVGALGGIAKQRPEIDNMMSKFNNSLAIQNIGSYLGASHGNPKSRNVQGSFKTTASIGSTKGAGKSMLSNT
jgi:hypothetical protein